MVKLAYKRELSHLLVSIISLPVFNVLKGTLVGMLPGHEKSVKDSLGRIQAKKNMPTPNG